MTIGELGRLPLAVVCLAVSLLVSGCSATPGEAPASKPFRGRLTMADGKPVGSVLLHLHPLKSGFSCATEVDADGNFASEAPPGTYAFSVRRSEQATPTVADAGMKKVPAAYHETDLSRTVAINPDESVTIVLP